MWKLITEAWRYRYVSQNYVLTTLGTKYRRSVLGYLWSVLLPMSRYLIMGLVFAYVLKMDRGQFFTLLLPGMVGFQFMAACISGGTNAYVQNAGYLKKIYIPKLLFPMNTLLMELTNTSLVYLALIVLGLLTGLFHPTWSILFAIPAFFLTATFLMGVMLLTSLSMVWFHDTAYFVELLMQTLFFITPVMFPPDMLPSWLYQFNPFYYFVEIIRAPLAQGTLPDPSITGIAVLIALGSFFAGLALLNARQDDIVYKL